MARDRHLEEAFGAAAPAHFAWQTRAPVVSDEERALVRAAFMPLGARVLDLGCAEGATLIHLGEPAGAVGVDLFVDKLRFAARHVAGARFAAAAAEALPFRDGAFDHVLVRDVIHHVPDPAALVDECRRMLVDGGRLDVLEPCRYNPLVAMHALSRPAERGELRSTPRYLRRLLARRFQVTGSVPLQPFPLHRLAFHLEVGRPEWASRTVPRVAVAAAERLLGAVTPRAAWAYVHVRAVAAPR